MAAVVGGFFFPAVALAWFIAGLVLPFIVKVPAMAEPEEPTPSAQPLLGFQPTVYTGAFGSSTGKADHVVALCCIALAVVFLLTPAGCTVSPFVGGTARAL